MTKISATPTACMPRGNPRQPVLDRLDEFEQRLDQLIGRLSQLPRPDSARSNLQPLTSDARLPLADIVFTVFVTACVTLTAVLSVASLLQ